MMGVNEYIDISSIPPGTAIPSATLNLYYVAYGDNSPAGHPLTCYAVMPIS